MAGPNLARALISVLLTLGLANCQSVGAPTTSASSSAPPQIASATAISAPTATEIRLFAPLGPQGLNSGLKASQTVSGSCSGGSNKDHGRSDAWRCFGGSTIYDPCFNDPTSGSLACADAPWSASIVLLRLSEQLPTQFGNNDATGTALPWALELANGQQCVMIGGATATIAGMRINYGCPGGSVVGEPDRSATLWKVFFQAGTVSQLSQVAVSVGWY
jgi:hypothetical protein